METTVRRRGLDWAAALPLLCAAHCVASPLLVLAVPALGWGHQAEPLVQAASVLLAAVAAWSGIRAHGRRAVLLPLAAGVALWIASAVLDLHGVEEAVAGVAGGLLLAGGMLWSGRLRHDAACHHCGCPAHHDP
ncbi:MAG TPA: MerC family mercury resistance protein [Longimicrobium sp.]